MLLLQVLVLAAATESWGLKWKAPAGCIEPATLARAVEGKLGFSVFGAGAKHRIDGELTKGGAPKWRASFIAVDAEGSILGSRELTSDDASCHALDEKLAMVIAVMIDPRRQAPEPSPPPPLVAPPVQPEGLPPPPPKPPPEPLRESSSAAQEEFEKKQLHFGAFMEAYEGKYLKQLTPVEFYERIGEPEKVEALNSAGRVRGGLAVTGAVLMIGGLVSMLAGIAVRPGCGGGSGLDPCTFWGGTLALSLGTVVLMVSLFLPYPVDRPEVLREKADKYNKRLRQQLGLEAPGYDEPPTIRVAPTPQAAVQLTPRGLVF